MRATSAGRPAAGSTSTPRTARRQGGLSPRPLEGESVPLEFAEEPTEAGVPLLAVGPRAALVPTVLDALDRYRGRNRDRPYPRNDLPKLIPGSEPPAYSSGGDEPEWLPIPLVVQVVDQILDRPRDSVVVLRRDDDKPVCVSHRAHELVHHRGPLRHFPFVAYEIAERKLHRVPQTGFHARSPRQECLHVSRDPNRATFRSNRSHENRDVKRHRARGPRRGL